MAVALVRRNAFSLYFAVLLMLTLILVADRVPAARRLSDEGCGPRLVSKQFNAGMLAEAVCKLEGFTRASTSRTKTKGRRCCHRSRM